MIILVSGNYVITNEFLFRNANSDEVYIVCDTSSGPVTITMPEITQNYMNGEFYISDGASNAATNNITILSYGSDLINEASGIVLNTNNACCSIFVASSSDTGDNVTSPKSMWIAGKSTSGGGGGGYGANNGVSLVGTNFQLGGTLIQNTAINNNGFDLDIYSNVATPSNVLLDVRLDATGTAIQSRALSGYGIRSFSSSGINLESVSSDDYTALFIRGASSINDAVGVLQIVRGTTGTPFGGIGGSIDFWIEHRVTIPVPAPTEPTARIAGVWASPGPAVLSRLSRLDFYGYSNGAGNVLNASILGDGLFSLYQYGLGTFLNTPAYSLGVDASGNVIETSVGGNANIQYILEANLLALELANNLDLNTIYVVTDTPNFMLMCKAETTSKISNTATIVDAGVGSYSGSVNYVSRDSTIATRIGSIVINDDAAGLPQESNQWFGVMPSVWVLGVGSRYNTFYCVSNGTLGDNCEANTFHQSGNNTLGDNCSTNTFHQSSNNTLGDNCNSNIFEQSSFNNDLNSAGLGQCEFNKFGLRANTNTLGNSCASNTFEQNANDNILGDTCSSNIFESGASQNTLGVSCAVNTFEQATNNNTLGDTCTYNKFEQGANTNTLGDGCLSNTFEQEASVNILANNCSYNTFEQNASSNTLGASCIGNTFKQEANSNSLGATCSNNIFEQNSNSNTLVSKCTYNTFEQGAFSNDLATFCGRNTFKKYSGFNKLLNYCTSNTFEQEANSNILDNNCYYNTFKQNANNNTLGDGCLNNTFEQEATTNTLGDSCSNNTFEQSSGNNILGIGCLNNTFEQQAGSNTLGDTCQANTFGKKSNVNTLGDTCTSNIFESGTSSNTLGDSCAGNTFRQGTSSNILGDGCLYNTFGQGVNGFTFASNLLNVTVEGQSLGLDLTPIGYAFIYGNSTPAVIRYDGGNAQWYHQYYDTGTSAWITTNL